jgi:hypothetical protein
MAKKSPNTPVFGQHAWAIARKSLGSYVGLQAQGNMPELFFFQGIDDLFLKRIT